MKLALFRAEACERSRGMLKGLVEGSQKCFDIPNACA
jgi:hypothetical protein